MSFRSYTLFVAALLTLSFNSQSEVINFTFSVDQSYVAKYQVDENSQWTKVPTEYTDIEPLEVTASYAIDLNHSFDRFRDEISNSGSTSEFEYSEFTRYIFVTDYLISSPFTSLVLENVDEPEGENEVIARGISGRSSAITFVSRLYRDLVTGELDQARSFIGFIFDDGFDNFTLEEYEDGGILGTLYSRYNAASFIVFDDFLVDFDENYFDNVDLLNLLYGGNHNLIRYNEYAENRISYDDGSYELIELGFAGNGNISVQPSIVVSTSSMTWLFASLAFMVLVRRRASSNPIQRIEQLGLKN